MEQQRFASYTDLGLVRMIKENENKPSINNPHKLNADVAVFPNERIGAFDLMSSKVTIRIVGKINRKGVSDVYTTHIVQDIKKLDSFDGMCTMPIHSPSTNSSGSLYHTRPRLHHYKS